MHHGAARYRKASQANTSARDTELAAFTAITRGLQSAGSRQSRVHALGRNHDLWSLLLKDLALDSNRLPPELKANLIGLALWSMRYSTLAILQDLPVAPLVDVNTNIAEGLILQISPAPLTLPATSTPMSTGTTA